MSSKQSETVKLTARFKVRDEIGDLFNLFDTYEKMVNELLIYAYHKGITSFKRLKSEKYHELRQKYPDLPSHYIYTACQMATSIYKSYRKRKRRGRARGKPVFRKDTVMLDDLLFKLDINKGMVKLSTPNGRITLKVCVAEYHEKFKELRIGQAWLVRKEDGVYINVVFSKNVEINEPENVVGIDLNENNVTLSLPNGEFVQLITHEKEIRTAYYRKRRKIQRRLKTGKKRLRLLRKYGEREKNRINDLYHKIANKIVELVGKNGISLEDLKNIRDSVKYSREMNGRLHRWSFRKLQSIIEYKAKLRGIRIVYVNPEKTSTLCPICGGRLSPNGHRVMKCKCGFEADRDIIGSWNIRLKALKMWGASAPPESPSMNPLHRVEGGRLAVTKAMKVTTNQNGRGSSSAP